MAITKQASSMVMVEMVTMMTVSFRPIDMSREAGIYLVLGASAAIDTLQAHGLLYRSAFYPVGGNLQVQTYLGFAQSFLVSAKRRRDCLLPGGLQ